MVHVEQNQVINLTASLPNYKTLAGCYYMNEKISGKNTKSRKNSDKTYTITIPTLPPKKKSTTTTMEMSSRQEETSTSTYYSTYTSDTETTFYDDWTTDTTTDYSHENLKNDYELSETTTQKVKIYLNLKYLNFPAKYLKSCHTEHRHSIHLLI